MFGIRQIHWPLSFYQQYRWKKKERSVSGKKNKFVRSGVGQNGDIHTQYIDFPRSGRQEEAVGCVKKEKGEWRTLMEEGREGGD